MVLHWVRSSLHGPAYFAAGLTDPWVWRWEALRDRINTSVGPPTRHPGGTLVDQLAGGAYTACCGTAATAPLAGTITIDEAPPVIRTHIRFLYRNIRFII